MDMSHCKSLRKHEVPAVESEILCFQFLANLLPQFPISGVLVDSSGLGGMLSEVRRVKLLYEGKKTAIGSPSDIIGMAVPFDDSHHLLYSCPPLVKFRRHESNIGYSFDVVGKFLYGGLLYDNEILFYDYVQTNPLMKLHSFLRVS